MSNINPYNIDGTYPIAGQDNDSQGFRDNFTNIRNNFNFAYQEISDLQSKAIVTSALTGTTVTNNMAGTVLQAPMLLGFSETVVDQGSVGGTVTLNFANGNVQKLATSSSVTLSFSGWPTTGTYGAMRLWITVTNASHTMTLPFINPGITLGLSDIAGSNTSTGVVTFDTAGTYVFEFSTVNAGNDILITDLTRNFATFRDPNFYFNDNVTPTLLVGFGAGQPTVLSLEVGQDVVSAGGSYNSVGIGTLSLANTTQLQMDTGGVAGYSVSAARGNIQTATIQPVQSGDIIGYHNSIAFTGNGSGNVFQQISSINFFATGSNVNYGLGGNIAFYTADDGGLGVNRVVQAVGIENDQSTKIYGNLFMGNLAGVTSSSYYPLHNTSAGTPGQVAWNVSAGTAYFYICVGTNSWQRVQLSASSW